MQELEALYSKTTQRGCWAYLLAVGCGYTLEELGTGEIFRHLPRACPVSTGNQELKPFPPEMSRQCPLLAKFHQLAQGNIKGPD